ncbi:MAG: hypothetical protein K2X87_15855 [Gemmataceae bacterium]|nr:hypothetical protein [Gemmataceae bacterium]
MRVSLLAVVLVSGWAPALGRAEDGDALRDRAVAAHEASLAAIRTLRATVAVSVELTEDSTVPNAAELRRASPTLPGFNGEYRRDGQRVRIDTREGPTGTLATIINLADRTTLTRREAVGAGARSGSVEATSRRDVAHDSPLDLGDGYLFFLPHPVPPDYEAAVPLARAVARAKRVTARTEVLDGAETVRLDLTMDGNGNRFEVWLDVGANYLFRRIRTVLRGDPSLECRISEYAEPKPGVFVPARAERVVFRASRCVLTVSDIRVNEPIPASLFDTRLPAGTRVTDHEEGKIYEVGAIGIPEKVVGRVIFTPPINSSMSTSLAATPLDADEPGRWSWPRVLLGVSILLVVGGLVVRQRRRAAG